MELIVKVAALEQQVSGLQGEIFRRLESLEAQWSAWHDDLRALLTSIERETRATNGRVTKHDGLFDGAMRRFTEIGHALEGFIGRMDRFDSAMRRIEASEGRPEGKPRVGGISQRDVTVFLAGGAAVVAAYRFAEWAFGVLTVVVKP